jgi:hypothetical protein
VLRQAVESKDQSRGSKLIEQFLEWKAAHREECRWPHGIFEYPRVENQQPDDPVKN